MQQDLGSILAYALYFIVLFAIGLYHMKDTGDMQSYMLGGRKIGPVGFGNERGSLGYERLDADGPAGLCLCCRRKRFLDCCRACARHMAELAFCCAAPAYLHQNRQRFHYAAGLF